MGARVEAELSPKKRGLAPAGVYSMPESVTPVSNVLISGDLLFLSGQAGLTADGQLIDADAPSEIRQALTNLRICLEAGGCTPDDCLQVTCYLASLDDFEAYNDVFREFFTAPYPARVTVQAGLLMNLRVEISAIARIPAQA
jgi:2-iminobutanoate/2-iminopropanoate deaminase